MEAVRLVKINISLSQLCHYLLLLRQPGSVSRDTKKFPFSHTHIKAVDISKCVKCCCLKVLLGSFDPGLPPLCHLLLHLLSITLHYTPLYFSTTSLLLLESLPALIGHMGTNAKKLPSIMQNRLGFIVKLHFLSNLHFYFHRCS